MNYNFGQESQEQQFSNSILGTSRNNSQLTEPLIGITNKSCNNYQNFQAADPSSNQDQKINNSNYSINSIAKMDEDKVICSEYVNPKYEQIIEEKEDEDMAHSFISSIIHLDENFLRNLKIYLEYNGEISPIQDNFYENLIGILDENQYDSVIGQSLETRQMLGFSNPNNRMTLQNIYHCDSVTVQSCILRESNQLFVVKEIKQEPNHSRDKFISQAEKQIQRLKQINEDQTNIMLPFLRSSFHVDEKNQLEYCKIYMVSGIKDLFEIKKSYLISEKYEEYAFLIEYAYCQLLNKLNQMHLINKLAHSDIKPQNIILGYDFNFYFIDFESSIDISHENELNSYLSQYTEFYNFKKNIQKESWTLQEVIYCDLSQLILSLLFMIQIDSDITGYQELKLGNFDSFEKGLRPQFSRIGKYLLQSLTYLYQDKKDHKKDEDFLEKSFLFSNYGKQLQSILISQQDVIFNPVNYIYEIRSINKFSIQLLEQIILQGENISLQTTDKTQIDKNINLNKRDGDQSEDSKRKIDKFPNFCKYFNLRYPDTLYFAMANINFQQKIPFTYELILNKEKKISIKQFNEAFITEIINLKEIKAVHFSFSYKSKHKPLYNQTGLLDIDYIDKGEIKIEMHDYYYHNKKLLEDSILNVIEYADHLETVYFFIQSFQLENFNLFFLNLSNLTTKMEKKKTIHLHIEERESIERFFESSFQMLSEYKCDYLFINFVIKESATNIINLLIENSRYVVHNNIFIFGYKMKAKEKDLFKTYQINSRQCTIKQDSPNEYFIQIFLEEDINYTFKLGKKEHSIEINKQNNEKNTKQDLSVYQQSQLFKGIQSSTKNKTKLSKENMKNQLKDILKLQYNLPLSYIYMITNDSLSSYQYLRNAGLSSYNQNRFIKLTNNQNNLETNSALDIHYHVIEQSNCINLFNHLKVQNDITQQLLKVNQQLEQKILYSIIYFQQAKLTVNLSEFINLKSETIEYLSNKLSGQSFSQLNLIFYGCEMTAFFLKKLNLHNIVKIKELSIEFYEVKFDKLSSLQQLLDSIFSKKVNAKLYFYRCHFKKIDTQKIWINNTTENQYQNCKLHFSDTIFDSDDEELPDDTKIIQLEVIFKYYRQIKISIIDDTHQLEINQLSIQNDNYEINEKRFQLRYIKNQSFLFNPLFINLLFCFLVYIADYSGIPFWVIQEFGFEAYMGFQQLFIILQMQLIFKRKERNILIGFNALYFLSCDLTDFYYNEIADGETQDLTDYVYFFIYFFSLNIMFDIYIIQSRYFPIVTVDQLSSQNSIKRILLLSKQNIIRVLFRIMFYVLYIKYGFERAYVNVR